MHTFAEKPKATQPTKPSTYSSVGRSHVGQGHDPNSILRLQRTIGNQAVLRLLQSNTEERNAVLAGTALPRFGHNFARIPVTPSKAGSLQTKLAINEPEDEYEQEADRVAAQVMRMPEPQMQRACPCGGGCPKCQEEEMLQRKTAPAVDGVDSWKTLRQPEAKVNAVSEGQPLTNEQKAFFEPRFGVDFSSVRVHTDASADTATRAVGAYAYTRGSDIVFREGQYRPHTYAGRQLLAHELTHVVQQGAAPRLQYRATDKNGERQVLTNELHTGMANHLVQRWPGDGMVPPGDCSWAHYLVLRGSVETAKAVVSTLGACSPGDSCLFLAAKIAAITAEIAARVALDATCFRGGDTGHRQQVQDKINMMNRCYRFFANSNCPPELIAAMAVVVESARAVIAAAAATVAIALVVALIAAIIALAEAIAALAAAAAEAAAIGAAVAAVIAVLILIRDELAPGESPSA
jgi:hypothetical protein